MYVAELIGILMAVGIAIKAKRLKAMVFTDNQAAPKTIREPKCQSGQDIVSRIIHRLADADPSGICVELQWIPAHRGIRGHELADQLAKEATGRNQARGRRGRFIHQDSDYTALVPDFLMHLKSARLNKGDQGPDHVCTDAKAIKGPITTAYLTTRREVRSSFRCAQGKLGYDSSYSAETYQASQTRHANVGQVTKITDLSKEI